jgi:hypothetical protein
MADLIPPLFRKFSDYRDYFVEEVKANRIPREPKSSEEKKGYRTAVKDNSVRKKYMEMKDKTEGVEGRANRTTESPEPTQRNLFDDSSPTQPRLPTPQATEEEPVVNAVNPNQQSFSFGETAQDFRSDAEVQKDLLTKIFDTLLDISKNVSLMAEGFPDLLEASKSVDKLKQPNRLADQEAKNEDMAKSLKASGASVIQNTAQGVFGFFEKLFAILTPFLLGLVVSFMDLTNPLQLLKDSLLILAAFIVGKFIYQLGKALTLTLISKLLEKFVGPKIINAPNSIINAGGTGTGVGTGGGGFIPREGVVNRRGRAVSAATQSRFARRFGTQAAATRFVPVSQGTGALNTATNALGLGAMTTGGIAGGTGVPAGGTPAGSGARTTATARALGGIKTFGRVFLPLALLSSLVGAPSLYFQKRDEGKGRFRAGAEATAGVGGGLLGGVLTGAATGAALGALGANPFTIALGGAIGAVAGGIMGEKIASSFTEKVFNFFGGEPIGGTVEEGFLFSKEFAAMTPEQRNQINISSKDYDEFNKRFGIAPISQLKTEELEQMRKDITAKEPEPPKDGSVGSFMTQFNQQTSVQNRFTGKMEAESAPHQCGLGSNLSKSK